MATGSEISEVIFPAKRAGLRPPPYCQYSRPDEVALFVGDVVGVAEALHQRRARRGRSARADR
jgi:hypothetical protein